MANRSWSSWTWTVGLRLLVAAALVVPVDHALASVQALVLVALVAAVALVGGALAKLLLGGAAARDRRFAAAVLGIAVCVVTGAVIGHFGALTGTWFRGVLAVLVLASVLATAIGEESLARWGARRGAPPAGGYPVHSPSVRRGSLRSPWLHRGATVVATSPGGSGAQERARRGRLRATGSPPPGAPHVVASTSGERDSGADTAVAPMADAWLRGRGPLRVRSALWLRGPLGQRQVERVVLWAALSLVLAALSHALVRYRDAAPGRFNYDDTSYHLTAIATWNVHHDLRMPRFTFGDPRTAFYPFASELLAWELTTPFGGGDFAARWVELPFALLTLAGVALVARRLGAGQAALLAPLLYATVSEAWPSMAMTAGNDHALAFAAIAIVHGALLLWERPRVGTGVYVGAGLGLLLATKYLGVIYAPLLVALVVLAVVVTRRHEWWRARAAALMAVVGGAAVVGGYAYLRNWVTTGNPLFPVSLRLGGWSLPGWADVTPSAWRASGEAGFEPWLFPWLMVEKVGWPFRFTMLPAAVLAPIAALLSGPQRRRLALAWLFALPLGIYLLFVFLVEDHRGVRYLLPALAIAAVAVAWLMSRLPPRLRLVASIALAALAAAPWVVDDPAMLLLLPVAALVVWRLRGRRPSPELRRAWALGATLAGILAVAFLAPAAMRRYDERRYRHDAAAAALERLAGGAAVRVAYAGGNQPYLFCGRRLRNALFMPAATLGGETMFYRWRGPLEEPPARRPRQAWERNVERLGIDWVVWRATGEGIRPEREWMLRSPGQFSRVYMDERAEIWQVRR